MKKILTLQIILVLLICCTKSDLPSVKAEINDKEYKFEVANTSETRQKGLMYRKKLNKNGGMLFVYPEKKFLSFYMKNTIIDLDIAFMDENFIILNIEEMKALDETSIYSKGKALYALEVNRGFFKRVGIEEGDKIKFITPIPYIVE